MSIKERWKGTTPIKVSTEELIDSVCDLFSSDDRVHAAYLFGSRSEGGNRAGSDVDLAFHASRDFHWDDYYGLRGALTKRLKSERLDLVWLDVAGPVITFEIIRLGRVFYYRDADLINEFELYAKKRFWDHREYLRKRHRLTLD